MHRVYKIVQGIPTIVYQGSTKALALAYIERETAVRETGVRYEYEYIGD